MFLSVRPIYIIRCRDCSRKGIVSLKTAIMAVGQDIKCRRCAEAHAAKEVANGEAVSND